VPYTIHHSGGSTTVTANQRINGGLWKLLGSFTMAPGLNHRVELTNLNAGGAVVADAVVVLPPGVEPGLPVTTWDLEVVTAGTYDVYGYWWADTDRATDTPYTIDAAAGSVVTFQGWSWRQIRFDFRIVCCWLILSVGLRQCSLPRYAGCNL